jgi:two-component system sensor kinase FixL
MGQMTAALAHELNQPLTAIGNYVTAARRNMVGGGATQMARAMDFIDKAANQTARAGQIIRQLREFVEKRETTRTKQNLNNLVEETIALLCWRRRRGLNFTDIDASVPPVLIDKVRWGRCSSILSATA